MKKTSIITGFCCFCLICFGMIGPVAGAPTKVLINIVEEQGDAAGAAMIKSSEMLIARELLKRDLEVMTSDDIAPREGLSEKDVKSARAGSMTELRKAAALPGGYRGGIRLLTRLRPQLPRPRSGSPRIRLSAGCGNVSCRGCAVSWLSITARNC